MALKGYIMRYGKDTLELSLVILLAVLGLYLIGFFGTALFNKIGYYFVPFFLAPGGDFYAK